MSKKHDNAMNVEEENIENINCETEEQTEETQEANTENANEQEATQQEELDPVTKAQLEAEQWKDKYIRLVAEFDNYKKRTLKEKNRTNL